MANVVHILFSGLGGTTEYVKNLIKGDKQRINNYHIVFFGKEQINSDIVKEFESELNITPRFILKNGRVGFNSLRNLKAELKFKENAKIVLHVNSLILPLFLMRKAKDVVFVEHQANHLKSKKEKLWSKMAQKHCFKVVSFTQKYFDDLKSLVGEKTFKTSKNVIVPTGIDLERYRVASRKSNPTNQVKFGIISRINGFRDHTTLLEAFELIESEGDVSLYIAGEGDLKDQLMIKYQENKNIHWKGYLNQDDIVVFLNSLDCYVIASHGESNSIALMQAQATGLPIIATKVNGISDVLNEEDCIFVQPTKREEYRRALISMLQKDVRENYSKKSVEFADLNLDHIKMFNGYQKILNQ